MSYFTDHRLPSDVFRGVTYDEWVLFAEEAGEWHPPYSDQVTHDERLTIMESSPTARKKYGLVIDLAF
jgi:hypothetical protein